MPIDENGTPTNSSQPGTQSQPTGSVSDLGDILMDKSLEKVEKNDFVPVSKNDIAGFGDEESDGFPQPTGETTVKMPEPNQATIDDLHNIMLDDPASTSASTATIAVQATDGNTETTAEIVEEVVEEVVEDSPAVTDNEVNSIFDIKLDDIGVASPASQQIPTTPSEETTAASTDVTTEEWVTMETDADTANDAASQDMSTIDLGTPEVTVEGPNSDIAPVLDPNTISDVAPVAETIPDAVVVPETPAAEAIVETVAVPETAVQEVTNTIDINVDWLADMLQPDIAASEPEVPTNTEANTTEQGTEEHTSIDEAAIPTVDEVIVENASEPTPSTQPIEVQVDSTTNTVENSIVTPVVDIISPAQLATETQPSPQLEPIVSQSPETAHLDKIAEDITQGIDLDSLVSGPTPPPITPVATTGEGVPTTTQTAKEWLKAMFSGPAGQKKLMLVVLGGLMLVWVIFFGLQAASWPSSSTPSAPTTNTTPEEPTTEETTPTPEVAINEDVETTGNVNSESETPIDENSTIEEPTDPVDEPTTPAPKTSEELLLQGKSLDGNIKKASIKAALAKNDTVRKQLFQLQKEVQGVLQTLANTTDITTLSDSEKQLTTFSQRLDTLLTELNNGSGQ